MPQLALSQLIVLVLLLLLQLLLQLQVLKVYTNASAATANNSPLVEQTRLLLASLPVLLMPMLVLCCHFGSAALYLPAVPVAVVDEHIAQC